LPQALASAENPFITLLCPKKFGGGPGFPQHREVWQR